MSIVSFTGLDLNHTILEKFKVKEKRYITSRIYPLLVLTPNEIYTKKLKLVFKIFNKKVNLINYFYRNYKIKKINKLNNCYKRLHFNKIFNDKYICDDIIYKIFNSLIILKK